MCCFREVNESDLNELLELYLHLHEITMPEMTEHLDKTWKTIMQDENHHIPMQIIVEKDTQQNV